MPPKSKNIPDSNANSLYQQYKGVYDNAIEAIITIDAKGIIQSANNATRKLFGWSQNELIGKNIKVLMPTSYAKEHNGYLKNYSTTGKAKIIGIGREVEGLKKNGSVFPMHLSVSEFKLDAEIFYSGIIHDLTQSKESELRLKKTASITALLHRTAESANAATSVDDAIMACLKDVCTELDWHIGMAWFRDTNNSNTLSPSKQIYTAQRRKYNDYVKEALATTYEVGSKITGKVFKTAKPEWFRVKDVKNIKDSRVESTLKCGIRTIIVTPVMKGKKVAAVLEFATEHEIAPDQELLLALKQISTQIGRVIERQELTEKIEKSEAQFRDFAASTADRFWQTDENHRFVYISESPSGFGARYPTKSMIGKTRWELDYNDANTDFWRAHKLDMDAHKPFYNLHYSRTFPDGQKTYLRATGIPIFDDDNNFIGYRGTNLDETEYVVADLNAAETHQRLFKSMEHLNDGFAVWDQDNRFVDCNSTYLEFHHDVAHTLNPGDRCEDFLRARFKINKASMAHQFPDDWLDLRLAELDMVKSEYEIFAPDGKWFLVRKQRLDDGHYVVFQFDITNRKKSEDDLRDALNQAQIASHSKSEFLANMSHELRTPLNAIIGFSDALKSNIFGQIANPKQEEYIDAIHESGEHLLGLISNILDVSTIEEGKLELQESSVKLPILSDEVLRMVERRAAQHGKSIINKFTEKLPSVFGDALRLKQVLANLVSNAVKFTPPGGKITLAARLVKNGDLRLSVKDTGIGMSAEEIEIALTRFGKVSAAMSNEEGTGLGIPLAVGLMEAHGGKLEIRSTPGRGTTVTAVIPKERVLAKK
jgi:PAS domain S-box-containing protein